MKNHERERQERAKALLECALILGEQMSRERLDGYLRLFEDTDPRSLHVALDACLNDPDRGRYGYPKPADIRAKLPKQSMHMNADEAWPIAMSSFDESISLVWTQEIEQARNVALPVWLDGDKIGARMAFRAAYERLIDRAQPPQWKLTPGHDPEQRREAVEQARAVGLLSDRHAEALLPSPAKLEPDIAAVAGLLTGNVVELRPGTSSVAKRLREAFDAGLKVAEKAEQDAVEKRKADAEDRSRKFEASRRDALESLRRMESE